MLYDCLNHTLVVCCLSLRFESCCLALQAVAIPLITAWLASSHPSRMEQRAKSGCPLSMLCVGRRSRNERVLVLVRFGKSAACAELATFYCAVSSVLMLEVRLEDRWAKLLRCIYTILHSKVIRFSECRRSSLVAIRSGGDRDHLARR